jgi:hypothetical protein
LLQADQGLIKLGWPALAEAAVWPALAKAAVESGER